MIAFPFVVNEYVLILWSSLFSTLVVSLINPFFSNDWTILYVAPGDGDHSSPRSSFNFFTISDPDCDGEPCNIIMKSDSVGVISSCLPIIFPLPELTLMGTFINFILRKYSYGIFIMNIRKLVGKNND